MPDIMQEKSNTPEEEIRELEQKLEQKKQELAGQSMPEKEVFREVIREKIEAVKPAAPSTSSHPAGGPMPTNLATQKADDQKKKEEREADVRALIEIAMTRGIESAVKYAEAESPYLLDELHDHLIDDYYEKLIALRKLKQL